MVDLVDLILEKRFVGQDFLTWLWFKGEVDGPQFVTPTGLEVSIGCDYDMQLECGEGETCQRITFKGGAGIDASHGLPESVMGIRQGKKIQQVKLYVIKGELEYILKINGSHMDISGARLPRTAPVDAATIAEGALDEGFILERIHLIITLMEIFDDVFSWFLSVRLGPAWPSEAGRFSDWLQEQANKVEGR